MLQPWRWIDSGARSPAENVAVDSLLFDARARGSIQNTVRVFRFSSPAVLVGFHQMAGIEHYRPFCEQRGVSLNRRLTGGGAVYVDGKQLGWEVVVQKDSIPGPRNFSAVLRWASEGVIRGLARMGMPACFQPRSRICIAEKSVSPVTGFISGETVLVQGVLFLDYPIETMVGALQIPLQKLSKKELNRVREDVTWLEKVAEHPIPVERVQEALYKGYEDTLGVSFGNSSYDWEQELASASLKFSGPDWIYRIPETNRVEADSLRAVYKANGNLLRIGVKVDLVRKQIQEVLFTGDLMVCPRDFLQNLADRLRGAPVYGYGPILERCFEEDKPDFLNFTCADFIQAMDKALSRLAFYHF